MYKVINYKENYIKKTLLEVSDSYKLILDEISKEIDKQLRESVNADHFEMLRSVKRSIHLIEKYIDGLENIIDRDNEIDAWGNIVNSFYITYDAFIHKMITQKEMLFFYNKLYIYLRKYIIEKDYNNREKVYWEDFDPVFETGVIKLIKKIDEDIDRETKEESGMVINRPTKDKVK